MNREIGITCVFLDIGGVLLTDGWDHLARRRAAKNFQLEGAEMENRHQLTFEIFEEGKITLDEYLDLVCLPPKAELHAQSVSALYVRAVQTLP